MRQRVWPLLLACAVLPMAGNAANMPAMPGMAMHDSGATQTKDVGTYRIELHVLPPEAFYSAAEAAAKHISAGMLIIGGAAPVAVSASPPPNHHLIVHVFDRASGSPVTDARVRLSFRAADAAGKPSGPVTQVPVVTMQAIGAGAASTHYGNNVLIPAGSHSVTVQVNGTTAHFPVEIDP